MRNKMSLFRPEYSTIMSLKAGYAVPCLTLEMYPNDRIVLSHEALLKAAPMLFPLYSPMKMRIDYFFNENRNVWRGDETKDWSTFITGSINGKAVENPDDLPVHPYITVPEGGFKPGSLGDYLDFSSETALAGAKLSALRFRHYNAIMKSYYLDENFSTMPEIALTDGEDTTTNLELVKVCWNKDRFTTAALEPQKGLSVGVPLAGEIPVIGNGTTLGLTNGTINYGLTSSGSPAPRLAGFSDVYGSNVSTTGGGVNVGEGNILGVTTDPAKSGLVGKLSEATQIPIDDLHFLVQVERLNQRDNMWGSRDFECIRTHFGCIIPDTRIQRPTHLGYSIVDVHFSEVLQTSQSTDGADGSPQGNITGHTMAVDASHPIRFRALEHGFLMGIVTIMPVAQYQQGVPRDSLYKTRYDYMWPILSETGEQEIFEAELYATSANVQSRKIFGFEPRYNHLRYGNKTVHGDFRTSLNAYHAGRIFTSEPNLGESFVQADPTNRMFAVEFGDVQPWWLRMEFNIKMVRRLPKWPTPSSIGKLF